MIKLYSRSNPLIVLFLVVWIEFVTTMTLADNLSFFPLVFLMFILGISFTFMHLMLLGKNWKDFFGEVHKNVENIYYNEVLVLGHKVETNNEDEDAFERELRLSSPLRNKIKIILIALALLVVVMMVVLLNSNNIQLNIWSYGVWGPLIVGASFVFAKAKSSLLVSILILFIASILALQDKSVYYGLIPLFFFFWQFRLIDKMNLRVPLESQKNIIGASWRAFLPAVLVFLLSNFLIPESFWNEQRKNQLSEVEKINYRLGARFNSPSKLEIARQRQRITEFKDVSNNLINEELALDYLNKMDKTFGESMDNLGWKDFSHRENYNLIRNEWNEHHREIESLRAAFESRESVSFSDDQGRELQERIKRLSERMSDFQKQHGEKIKNSTDPQEELRSMLQGREFDESSLAKHEIEEIKKRVSESSSEEYDRNIDDLISQFESKKSPKTEPTALINPKLLKSILGFIKIMIVVISLIFFFKLVMKFFEEDKIEYIEDEEGVFFKKKLLRKKTYKDQGVEILTLYKNCALAAQRIHFSEEEIPPPQILKECFKIWTLLDDEITYFTEVFSLSYYSQKKMTKAQMRKFRVIYQKIIKRL